MRKTPLLDDITNVYLEKLKKLYNATPVAFYTFIETLIQKPLVGLTFSNKT